MRLRLLDGDLAVVFGLPRRFHRIVVIGHVIEFFAALQHEDFEPFFGQFLRCPASGNTRADDNGIVGVFFVRFDIEISHDVGEKILRYGLMAHTF